MYIMPSKEGATSPSLAKNSASTFKTNVEIHLAPVLLERFLSSYI